MAVKYYRPRQQRGGGGIQIASKKRFLISIAIIAAIVVLIILLATQPWNAAGSEQNVPDEQASATDTVPAADTDDAENVLDNATEESTEPAGTDATDTGAADTEAADAEAASTDTESGDSAAETAEAASESDSGSSESSGKSYKTLKQGSKGDAVMKLQKRLSELGYLPGKATGYYGSVTVDCIKQFQENNGLTVDGIAGSATQSKLYSDSAVKK